MKIDLTISPEEMLLKQLKAIFFTGVFDGMELGKDITFGTPVPQSWSEKTNTSIKVTAVEGSTLFTPSNTNASYKRVPLSIYPEFSGTVEVEPPTTDKPIKEIIKAYMDQVRPGLGRLNFTLVEVGTEGFVDCNCVIDPLDLIFIGTFKVRYYPEGLRK